MSTIPQTSPGRTGSKATAKGERARRPVSRDAGKPLSNPQKSTISQTARQAFNVQDRAGLIEGTGSDTVRFEQWRRAEQEKCTGIASLRACGNNHYRGLMAHFLTLAGKDDSAFRYQLRTGRVKDHGAIGDTHENREEQRKLIVEALLGHGRRCDPKSAEYDEDIAAAVAEKGGIITQAYVITIARAKCRGRSLDSITATELKQILWTVRNRIAAREGRGKTSKRNKSQRATKRATQGGDHA